MHKDIIRILISALTKLSTPQWTTGKSKETSTFSENYAMTIAKQALEEVGIMDENSIPAKDSTVVIYFPDEIIAHQFMSWMIDGGGDQSFGYLSDIGRMPDLMWDFDFEKRVLTVSISPDEDDE